MRVGSDVGGGETTPPAPPWEPPGVVAPPAAPPPGNPGPWAPPLPGRPGASELPPAGGNGGPPPGVPPPGGRPGNVVPPPGRPGVPLPPGPGPAPGVGAGVRGGNCGGANGPCARAAFKPHPSAVRAMTKARVVLMRPSDVDDARRELASVRRPELDSRAESKQSGCRDRPERENGTERAQVTSGSGFSCGCLRG